MDRINKFLDKTTKKEAFIIRETINKILSQDTSFLNVKKIIDKKDLFRVRKGDFRIIFYMKDDDIEIVDVDRRNDNTYKQF